MCWTRICWVGLVMIGGVVTAQQQHGMAFWILGLLSGSDGLSGRLVLWLGLAFGLGIKALGGRHQVGASRYGREKISGYIDTGTFCTLHCL